MKEKYLEGKEERKMNECAIREKKKGIEKGLDDRKKKRKNKHVKKGRKVGRTK